MANSKLTKEQNRFLKALVECEGHISNACKKVGIARNTHYQWMNGTIQSDRSDEYKKEVEAIQEAVIDDVEYELMNQIKSGNSTSTIFFLKTRAKHRGYTEDKQEDKTVLQLPKGASIRFSDE